MIRKIKTEDISKIYELGKKHDNNFSDFYDLENYLRNEIYIINCYEEDNLIKGFIIATKMYETVEILLVYVDNNYRKQNIGTLLMNSIESEDTNNILLEVSVENIPALSLYKKLGYDIINVRKKYYNGIDAYIMKKVL